MPITTYEDTLKLLHVLAEHDATSDLWWRTDEKYAPATFFINCNDLFFWGCADCEEVAADDIDALDQAYKDAATAGTEGQGDIVYCCRKRKMRPQGAYYKHFKPEIAKLLDACGEPREVGFGNPVATDPIPYKPPSITLTQVLEALKDPGIPMIASEISALMNEAFLAAKYRADLIEEREKRAAAIFNTIPLDPQATTISIDPKPCPVCNHFHAFGRGCACGRRFKHRPDCRWLTATEEQNPCDPHGIFVCPSCDKCRCAQTAPHPFHPTPEEWEAGIRWTPCHRCEGKGRLHASINSDTEIGETFICSSCLGSGRQCEIEYAKPRPMIRACFYTNADDCRPIKFPPPGPYWRTGTLIADDFVEVAATMVAYAENEAKILEFWPDATNISSEPVARIVFTERFPPPDWWPCLVVVHGGDPT